MQPNWILHAATLLDDTVMMEWAIHYYRELPDESELKKQLENLWFHDMTLKRWIDSGDHNILSLLFKHLPEQRFSMFESTIAANWSTWPDSLANSAARILTTISPDLATTSFESYLQNARPITIEIASIILSNIHYLPDNVALPILEKLLPFASHQDELYAYLIRHEAFRAALALMPEVLPQLLDKLFSEDIPRMDGTLEFLADALLDHDAYIDLYFQHYDNNRVTFFSDLACLFDKDAPLAEMDEVLRTEDPLPIALRLLETHHSKSPNVSRLWEIIRQSDIYRTRHRPKDLAALALAGVAAAFEKETLDAAKLSLDEVILLLALDIRVCFYYEELVDRLGSFPRTEVAEAIKKKLELSYDSYGSSVLADLMGELGWAEFVQPLIACIDETQWDFLSEAASDALIKLGDPARDALIAQWDKLNSTQKIFGISVISKVGGIATADFALGRFDELMSDDMESCCALLMSSPDSRILAKLRPQLRRKQVIIDETYYRLCRLLDKESDDLAKVHERVLLQRQQQTKRIESFFKGDSGNDQKTLHLSLRCPVCNEVNSYDVKSVLVNHEGGKPLIADEFPCLSCGAWVDFQLEPMAYLAITAEQIRALGAHATGETNVNSLVSAKMAHAPGGGVKPVNSVYFDLKERLSLNPEDSLSMLRLGNISNQINRPKAAYEYFKNAYAINPLSIDIIINLAVKKIDFGEWSEAFDLLNSSLKRCGELQTIQSKRKQEGEEFAALYNQLSRHLGRVDLPLLHPNFLGSALKIGRNDPCPCGSGKKYKKCCMN